MGMMVDLQSAAGPALVVGGGKIATRKVRGLAEAEFQVTVISPAVSDEIRLAPHATVIERPFSPDDLAGDTRYALVFACTDDRTVNCEIGRLARLANIPVVVTDAQEESTFFTPAVLRDGDLAIAVSTGGASPRIARSIREYIVASIGPGWAPILGLARKERQSRKGRHDDDD